MSVEGDCGQRGCHAMSVASFLHAAWGIGDVLLTSGRKITSGLVPFMPIFLFSFS
jgi:hypothetical protein